MPLAAWSSLTEKSSPLAMPQMALTTISPWCATTLMARSTLASELEVRSALQSARVTIVGAASPSRSMAKCLLVAMPITGVTTILRSRATTRMGRSIQTSVAVTGLSQQRLGQIVKWRSRCWLRLMASWSSPGTAIPLPAPTTTWRWFVTTATAHSIRRSAGATALSPRQSAPLPSTAVMRLSRRTARSC